MKALREQKEVIERNLLQALAKTKQSTQNTEKQKIEALQAEVNPRRKT